MKRNVIDNSTFPIRKVVSVRPANRVVGDVLRFMTLECGHEVGLKGFDAAPDQVPCYRCDKAAKQ